MVVKRTCSFCAGEVEPGTGYMYVKRDGTVFHFCCSSCRKQQLHLGRVGHRLRWTHAHALKRAAEQRRLPAATAPAAPPAKPKAPAAGAKRPAAGAKKLASSAPARRKPAAPPAKETTASKKPPPKSAPPAPDDAA
jgi:large subunit ribosomal protein L24e